MRIWSVDVVPGGRSSFTASSRRSMRSAARSARARVVLVRGRHAEGGHHRVADELLDGAALGLDLLAHRLKYASHHLAEPLRIEPFAEGGRPGDVGEQDRDELALLAGAIPASATEAPHAGQNRAPSGSGVPHSAHTTASGAPHAEQNRASGAFSVPHALQVVTEEV